VDSFIERPMIAWAGVLVKRFVVCVWRQWVLAGALGRSEFLAEVDQVLNEFLGG
jgi:hypothetical protein